MYIPSQTTHTLEEEHKLRYVFSVKFVSFVNFTLFSVAVVFYTEKVRFAINFKRRSFRQFVAVGFEFVA